MKTSLASFSRVFASILISSAPYPLYGTDSASSGSAAAPFASCPVNGADSTFFVPDKELRVNKDYKIAVFRTRAPTADLKNVLAVLTKGADSDVQIPRITVIYYDGSPKAVVQANDKGDITIPSTAGNTVQVKFCLSGFNKTDWRHNGSDGGDSVFVAGPSTTPIPHAPASQGQWPCTGLSKNVTKSGNSISFPMCSHVSGTKDVYYSYGLHLDQIGGDQIGVEIGIDPQIINKAAVGP